MNYAELILESLLNEEATKDEVIDAIKKRYEVEIDYNHEGSRIIQPVAYGKTPKGNLVIRAYQTIGTSRSGKSHGWKEFLLSDITNWKGNKRKKFKEPPQFDAAMEGKFNPKGDKSMSEVYLVANFNGMKNDALIKYNKIRHDKKVAENPYYDLKRNIEKSYNAYDLDPVVRKNIDDWQKSQAAAEFRKGNGESVYDMSQITDFGDKKTSQTVGPVRKGNSEIDTTQTTEQPDYNGALANGPVYRQNIQQQNVDMNKYQTYGDNENDENNISDENSNNTLNGRK